MTVNVILGKLGPKTSFSFKGLPNKLIKSIKSGLGKPITIIIIQMMKTYLP